MKFVRRIFLSLAVILSMISLFNTQLIRDLPIPTAAKVAKEFLVQNTVKFAKQNELFQTDIDLHPSKYIILNNKSAQSPGAKYDKDTKAYYDPTILQAPNPIKRDFSIPDQKYSNSVYPLDQKPYYGPNDFRVFTNIPDDRIKVPVKLDNMTEKVPTIRNIIKLKRQLDSLRNQYIGPKYLSKETKERQVYQKDQAPYYDPSALSKQNKIEHLQNTIRDLAMKLNDNSEKPRYENVKIQTNVQNFSNKNKENTNKFIANSYYYDVDKKTLQKERVYSNRIRVGSPDKYYERTEQTLVEADSIDNKSNLKKK